MCIVVVEARNLVELWCVSVCWHAAGFDVQLTVGAFEGRQGQGLSLKAFLKWSKQLPALLTSLKSLLAAGSIDTTNAAASAANNVRDFTTHL